MAATILIIDDSQVILARVEQALRAAQVCESFLFAKDGVSGIRALLENRVDLVLCDVVMPGIDGFKFLSMMKAKPEYDDVPVLMLTGQEDVQAKVRGLVAGASDYITKPFNDEELVARIRVHLKIKELQDQLRAKNAELEALARVDTLTDTSTRRYFMEQAERELDRSRRHSRPMGFIMMDIDKFKAINDEYGHQAGDRVLVVVAQRIKAALRAHDIVGRYGGEEFVMALAEADLDGTISAAERCRALIANTTVQTDSGPLKVRASFGVAGFPVHSLESVETLIGVADTALYAAKAQGRDRVVVAPKKR